MRHWLQLGTRSWRASPGRSFASVLAVALGVGAVVAITSLHESARHSITDRVVENWVGTAHLAIHPPGAHWGALSVSLADEIATLDNVATVNVRMVRRSYIIPDGDKALAGNMTAIDAIGVVPETAQKLMNLPGLEGRSLRPADTRAAVLERYFADDLGVGLGDTVQLATSPTDDRISFEIVGLFESQSLASFQYPIVYLQLTDLQTLWSLQGKASVIEVELVDHSRERILAAEAAVEELVQQRGDDVTVETAVIQQDLLEEADRLTRLILASLAFVSLMTAFFIILTTMSMSLIQRRVALGVTRCLGLTRAQLVGLLMIELVPLGLFGTGVGLLLGSAAVLIADVFAQDHGLEVYVDGWGFKLALISGLVTTVIAAGILAIQVCRVSPLAATRPEANPTRVRYVVAAAAVGAVLIAMHEYLLASVNPERFLEGTIALIGSMTLVLGYVLLAVPLVMVVGRPIARAVARVLGLTPSLVDEPFTRAPWRGAGVCWMLMVGLSLIVYISVRADSLMSVWSFPTDLPETFVWSRQLVPYEKTDEIGQIAAVAEYTVMSDVTCKLEIPGRARAKRSMLAVLVDRFTRPVFVAGHPQQLQSMMKLSFAEGSREDAARKLERGGYVLIPTQTAEQHGLHVGDKVNITVGANTATFEVAGVVQSAAFELAVNYFHAESYMQFAASSAIFGTVADMREKFNRNEISLLLCNLNLNVQPRPDDFSRDTLPVDAPAPAVASAILRWAPEIPTSRADVDKVRAELTALAEGDATVQLSEKADRVLNRYSLAFTYITKRWSQFTTDEDWYAFQERLVLLKITETIERPDATAGSLKRLVNFVDSKIRQAIVIATWIPSIALIVASMGVGNLVMVSVHARSRQIAIMRAVGMLRSQIVRVVLAEAIALGLLGSMIGIALGIHLCRLVNQLTAEIAGLRTPMTIPYMTILLGVLLTVTVCVLAGIGPARYAARENIVEALQTT